MSHRPRVPVFLAAVVLAAMPVLQGCSSWKALKDPPATFAAPDSTRQYRVTAEGSPAVVLRRCRVENDTLTGYSGSPLHGIPATWVQEEWAYRVDIPVAAISRVETKEVGTGSTVALLWVVGGIAFLLLLPTMFKGS